MPRSQCQGCGFVQFKHEFAQQQWTKKNKRRFCKKCVARFVSAGTPFECTMCCLWKRKDAFDEKWHQPQSINTRVCKDCRKLAKHSEIKLCQKMVGRYGQDCSPSPHRSTGSMDAAQERKRGRSRSGSIQHSGAPRRGCRARRAAGRGLRRGEQVPRPPPRRAGGRRRARRRNRGERPRS